MDEASMKCFTFLSLSLITAIIAVCHGAFINGDTGCVKLNMVKRHSGNASLPGQKIIGHLCRIAENTLESHSCSNKGKTGGLLKYKLDLGNGTDPIYMNLRPQTVWDQESVLLAKDNNGVHLVDTPQDIPCIYSGEVTSEEGTASFTTCGHLEGTIETSEKLYELVGTSNGQHASSSGDINAVLVEEVEDNETDWLSSEEKLLRGPALEDSGQGVGVDALTRKKRGIREVVIYDEPIQDGDSEIRIFGNIQEGTSPEENELQNNAPEQSPVQTTTTTKKTTRTTTQTTTKKPAPPPPSVMLEVGLYLDESYLKALERKAGLKNGQEIRNYMIQKWNKVQEGFGNATLIGANITIKIRSIILWRKNPDFINKLVEADKKNLGGYLRGLCFKTSNRPKFDVKVLYTTVKSKNIKGLAYVGGICKRRQKCMVVKNPSPGSKLERHELGHVLGLRHEYKIKSCARPYGFMGGGMQFKTCYSKAVLKTIGLKSSRCLKKANVKLEDGLKFVEAN